VSHLQLENMLALTMGACALAPPTFQRRQVLKTALGAELAWRQAVALAATDMQSLPSGTVEALEAGRVVVVPNWLPMDEVRTLRADAESCYTSGRGFCLDALAAKSVKQHNKLEPADDRRVMPSFFASKGTDGPWVDDSIGSAEARKSFKARIAGLKRTLASDLHGRQTLAMDAKQTHELAYTRYGVGARLARHTDEHHGALKNAHPVASGDENLRRLTSLSANGPSSAASAMESSARGPTTRRSVTWLVYLNEDYDADRDGGQLQVHERAAAAVSPVGSRGSDLQIGWLKATATQGETPVFLDANVRSSEGGVQRCMLYACAADGRRRDLSSKPFDATPTLFLAGSGDFLARRLGLIDQQSDLARFHLIDVPKSAASTLLASSSPKGEDGGERVRTISPEAGTLVLFDSVAVPHEVLPTRRERYAVNGWFHEQI
jgi:hypothetical protein